MGCHIRRLFPRTTKAFITLPPPKVFRFLQSLFFLSPHSSNPSTVHTIPHLPIISNTNKNAFLHCLHCPLGHRPSSGPEHHRGKHQQNITSSRLTNPPTKLLEQSIDEHPATKYLTQTNSLGVVTGQPSVFTSQAAAVTSQEPAASIPAGLTSPVAGPNATQTTLSTATATNTVTGTTTSGTGTSKTTATFTSTGTSTSTSTETSDSSSAASSSAAASTESSTGGAAMATVGPVGLGMVAGAALVAFL
jgi:hypothetical protein